LPLSRRCVVDSLLETEHREFAGKLVRGLREHGEVPESGFHWLPLDPKAQPESGGPVNSTEFKEDGRLHVQFRTLSRLAPRNRQPIRLFEAHHEPLIRSLCSTLSEPCQNCVGCWGAETRLGTAAPSSMDSQDARTAPTCSPRSLKTWQRYLAMGVRRSPPRSPESATQGIRRAGPRRQAAPADKRSLRVCHLLSIMKSTIEPCRLMCPRQPGVTRLG
jgi:hypothetical protein